MCVFLTFHICNDFVVACVYYSVSFVCLSCKINYRDVRYSSKSNRNIPVMKSKQFYESKCIYIHSICHWSRQKNVQALYKLVYIAACLPANRKNHILNNVVLKLSVLVHWHIWYYGMCLLLNIRIFKERPISWSVHLYSFPTGKNIKWTGSS